MRAVEAVKKVTLSLIIFALVASSFTLWLIESSLKYVLYFFEVALILILFCSLFGKTIKIKYETRGNTAIKFDYAFLTISAILLVLTTLKLNAVLTMVCAIIVSFFLPGYVLLRLLKFHYSESWIEWLALSFALSIGVTSIIFTAMLPFIAHKAALLSVIYVGISLCPLLKDRIYKSSEKPQAPLENRVKKHDISDVLLLLWIIAFFVLAISSLYPRMALVPGADIVRHFSSSRLLALAPETLSSAYLWFHATWANVYELSSPPMEVFQTGLAYLSVMVIFSFYVMAKAYLKDVDRRAPVLATVFFSVFAGFGWLYFLQERLITTDPSAYYSLLSDAFNRSYFDVGYAQGWIWFWFRPITLGLTLFFILLYLLQERKLSKGTFMLIFTLILLTLNVVHFSESVVFVLFLLVLSLLKPTKELRLGEAATSSALAMLTSLPLLFAYQNIIGMSITAPLPSHLVLLTTASVLAIFLARLKKRPQVKSRKIVRWLILGVGQIYIWLLITWVFTAKTFTVTYVTAVYSVPWQFYPMLLGLSGLFAMFSSLIIVKRYSNHLVAVFLLLLLFAVLFGRALTYYNLNVSFSSYIERRIVTIAYAASAVIAPISIVELFKHIQKYKTVVLSALLTFIVIFSISSTFLALESRTYVTKNLAISDDDLKLVNVLNQLGADKVLLTVTDHSRSIAEFSPSSWIIDKYRYQLWPAIYPELPLNILFSMNKPVTIFLQEADIQKIKQNYASSYLFNHLVSYSSSNASAINAEIISLPNITAPSPNSQTVLVIPTNQDPNIWYAYDILSQGNLNYTTALIDDITTLSKAKTLIAPTESLALKLISYRELFKLKFENLIILNLDGYNDLSLNYFSSPKMTLSLDSASQKIATLIVEGVAVKNFTSIVAPREFEIRATNENGNFYDLLDENFEGWTTKGIGFGNISSPQLTVNHSIKISGNSSVQLDVTSGPFGYWQISKDFTPPINAENFDFISLYWYGKGDGKQYVLQFHSKNLSNYWYSFRDSWNGWKKVLIPMHISDGRYNLNGVYFSKATTGKPTWSNIYRIEVRNEASNPNLSGTFLIDKFGFESAENINVTLTTDASLHSLNYTLMGGLNPTVIFGNRPFLKINMTKNSNSVISTISVKLPRFINNINFSSIHLKIIPMTSSVEVDEISGQNFSLQLNTKINIAPLESNNSVIAWYKNKEESIPFAINDDVNGLKIIYVNIYPLTSNLVSDKSNYKSIGQIVHILNLNQVIGETQIITKNPVNGNLATFSKVDFEGNTTIHSQATVIIRKMSSTVTLTLPKITITDLSKIVFVGDDIILNTRNGSLNNGIGFYSSIYSDNLMVNSAARIVGTIILEFGNGTRKIVNESIHNIRINGNSVATLRQPTVQIDGKVTFYNLYTYASLANLLIFGKNATLEGKLAFDANFGDEFTVTSNFIYTGKINTNKYISYDELNALYQSLPIFFVTGLLFITAYAYALLTIEKSEPTGADE